MRPEKTIAETTTPEPTITCPKCRTEIKLTESLAAPLIEVRQQEFERRLAQKDGEVLKREGALHAREETLARERQTLDEQVSEKLRQERGKIAAEEARKARATVSMDLEQKTRENAELQEVLKQREGKLAEAQKAEAELRRKQRELEDARREIELTVEKRVQAGLDTTRAQARQEVEEQLNLKVREKEETISAMKRQIEDLKRSAEQGSQQLQGEVLELEMENLLGSEFPMDEIIAVPKGEHGGDVLQHVAGPAGAACGTILWESKRTKSWSDSWLPKLREDQRAAKAEISVIITQTLPKGVETFDCIDGVWVTKPCAALPVAMALRHTLLEVAAARRASEGQRTKAELVYDYLTSSPFRRRVEAIVEAFSSMQADLSKEKKAITRQWAKREVQINRVMEATVGMYGDLQGIAGKSLKEIEGIDLKSLSSGSEAASEE